MVRRQLFSNDFMTYDAYDCMIPNSEEITKNTQKYGFQNAKGSMRCFGARTVGCVAIELKVVPRLLHM